MEYFQDAASILLHVQLSMAWRFCDFSFLSLGRETKCLICYRQQIFMKFTENIQT